MGFRKVYVYPNPAKNAAVPILHVEAGSPDVVFAHVYDRSGELVQDYRMDGTPMLVPLPRTVRVARKRKGETSR